MILPAYLKLLPLWKEVAEEHQHVGGHRGHVGGVPVGSLCVAEPGAHWVVHKQHAGSLDLLREEEKPLRNQVKYFHVKCKMLNHPTHPARLSGLQVPGQWSDLLKVPETTSRSSWTTLGTANETPS